MARQVNVVVTLSALLVAAAFIVAAHADDGAAGKAPDQRVADLEAKIAALEARVQLLEGTGRHVRVPLLGQQPLIWQEPAGSAMTPAPPLPNAKPRLFNGMYYYVMPVE